MTASVDPDDDGGGPYGNPGRGREVRWDDDGI